MTKKDLLKISLKELYDLAFEYMIDLPQSINKQNLVNLIWENLLQDDQIEREENKEILRELEQKYFIFEGKVHNSISPQHFNLPKAYDTDKIRVLLKDANWLYVFWQLSQRTIHTMFKKGYSDFFLKIFFWKEGDFQKSYYTISIQYLDLFLYINVPQDDTFFKIQLLILSDDHNEKYLTESNTIYVPQLPVVINQKYILSKINMDEELSSKILKLSMGNLSV